MIFVSFSNFDRVQTVLNVERWVFIGARLYRCTASGLLHYFTTALHRLGERLVSGWS